GTTWATPSPATPRQGFRRLGGWDVDYKTEAPHSSLDLPRQGEYPRGRNHKLTMGRVKWRADHETVSAQGETTVPMRRFSHRFSGGFDGVGGVRLRGIDPRSPSARSWIPLCPNIPPNPPGRWARVGQGKIGP